MAEKRKSGRYSEKAIKKNRTFPTSKTVLLAVCIAVQAVAILFAVLYRPTPQDRIEHYEVIAEPLADGSVDLSYKFVWTALDDSEDLTWVEIGMANPNFEFYEGYVSDNIVSYSKHVDGDYVSARLDLDRPYKGGESLTFSFKVNQRSLLCQNEEGYFYAFVPGWFNETPVESYYFAWKDSASIQSVSKDEKTENGYYVWEGSMLCGEYHVMWVQYDAEAFAGIPTVEHEPFKSEGAYDSLREDRWIAITISCVVCFLLLIAEVFMVDSVVSYHRGRGFLTEKGLPLHLYGRVNPQYEKAMADKESTGGGRIGGGGHGCACACACACAGGGRAGCSQKDGYAAPKGANEVAPRGANEVLTHK